MIDVAKFKEKQLREFQKAEKEEKQMYIRDQIERLESSFNTLLDENLRKLREKRRMLGISGKIVTNQIMLKHTKIICSPCTN